MVYNLLLNGEKKGVNYFVESYFLACDALHQADSLKEFCRTLADVQVEVYSANDFRRRISSAVFDELLRRIDGGGIKLPPPGHHNVEHYFIN